RRAIELARDADIQIERNAELYFAATTPHYCTVHEGALELALRNPARAIELCTDVLDHSDESAAGTLAWLKWTLATACLSVRASKRVGTADPLPGASGAARTDACADTRRRSGVDGDSTRGRAHAPQRPGARTLPPGP